MFQFYNAITVLSLLRLLCIVVNGEEIKSYGLGFNHGDILVDESICMNEFNLVSSYVYPTYLIESTADSNIDTNVFNEIQTLSTTTTNYNHNKW